MSEQPAIGGTNPIGVDVEAGKDYYWCSCGKSAKQPFCDGSHKGSEFSPLKFTAPETKKAYFCTCKRTGATPLCDGSHKNLAPSA
jgi:CDGSH iron-sulfur domain-containing protein 3